MITLFLMFFSLETWACKPAPLPTCDKPEILLRENALLKLEEQTQAFQQTLTKGILESDTKGQKEEPKKEVSARTSCFNNNFAVFYLAQVKDYAKKHAKMICVSHLDLIDAQVKNLLEPSNLERKAVKIPAHQEKLNKLSVKVSKALDVFQGEHSK